MTDQDEFAGFASAQPSSDDEFSGFSPESATANKSSTEPVYDAAEFKRRVGREPEPAELANFKAMKGEGFSPGNHPGGSFTGMGEAALAAGAGTLKAVSHAANDILPDWGGSKAAVEKEIQTDPILNYRGGPDAQQYLEGLNTLMTPVTWTANKIHQGIANRFGERAADVAGDIATLAPGARGLGIGKKIFGRFGEPIHDPESEISAESPSAAATETPSKSMGAAQVNPSPFTLTGQETGRGSPSFPQVKLAKNAGDVAPEEQATRAGIVREILDDAGEHDAGIRTGVLTGNEQTLRSEYQAAKNPDQSPANKLFNDQIIAEQRALPKFAQQRIESTGADPTLNNDYQRGETINNAFYGEGGLKDYLDSQKRKIFQQALEKNGATKIETPNLDELLTDPQFSAGAKLMKHEGVVNGATDLTNFARTVGFRDPITGEQYSPGSVASWNAVTKALNRSWTPDNAATIGKINGAINADIAASGGGDLYALGNRIHQLEKSLLSDSPGINKVFGAVDPNGIQTAKPFENIPQTLNDMPLDQWRHIHDTLEQLSRGKLRGAPEGMDAVPTDLQQAAGNALSEMHGSLAREVYAQGANKVGAWNSNASNKILNGRVGQKIIDSFPPNEVRKFQVLNAAGEIMPGAHPYEGAGAQTARMAKDAGIVEKYAPAAGAYLGTHGAGPLGALVGSKVGEKISAMSKTAREQSHARQIQDALTRNRGIRNPDVTGRASGGKVDHEALVRRLMDRWHQARRETNRQTESLLKLPDESVIRALDIAQAHI